MRARDTTALGFDLPRRARPPRGLNERGSPTIRHVDDTKITDRHAIIPTDRTAGELHVDERRIYDLVCRRLLQAWHGDFVWGATTVLTTVRSTVRSTETDVFHSSGTVVEDQGWKVLDLGGGKKVPKQKKSGDGEPDEPEISLPSGLEKGQLQQIVDALAVEKQTRPPPRLNDATLLTAMETAGRTLDEKELSRAMKDSGLGTPATRAAIIESEGLVLRARAARRHSSGS